MASREVKLNSALCFVVNSCRKYPENIVKSLVLDFYNVDTISNAKDLLVGDITNMDLNVKLPTKHRKSTDNKFKMDLDDILNLLRTIDELGAVEKLPRYATDNLDELPITRMDSGGLSVVVNKLDNICEKLTFISQASRLQGPCGRANKPQIMSVDSDGGGMLLGDDPRWGDSAVESVSEDPFNDVISRQKRRKRNASQRLLVPSATPSESAPLNGNKTGVNYSAALQKSISAPVKTKRIIGRSNNVESQLKLKSAKPYIKKSIYGLYNVSSDETIESVSKFVHELCGASPISCFLINNKNSDESNSDTSQSIGFRICIDAEYSDNFLDPMAWANGIVIRPWKFKAKPSAPQANTQTAQA